MRINDTTPIRPGGTTAKTASGGAPGFGALLDAAESGGARGAAATGGVAATPAMAGLFALQEVSDEEHQRKKRVKRGQETLEALERLRTGLLTGALPLSVLRDIDRLVSEQRERDPDPALAEILDDIELRAAVELAKIEAARRYG